MIWWYLLAYLAGFATPVVLVMLFTKEVDPHEQCYKYMLRGKWPM